MPTRPRSTPPSAAVSPFAERVLALVERIPPGAVLAYSDVAELLDSRAPRAVGQVMFRYGAAVPWHRVVHADGTPAPHKPDRQLALLAAEGVPIRNGRVDMAQARWTPPTSGRRRPQR